MCYFVPRIGCHIFNPHQSATYLSFNIVPEQITLLMWYSIPVSRGKFPICTRKYINPRPSDRDSVLCFIPIIRNQNNFTPPGFGTILNRRYTPTFRKKKHIYRLRLQPKRCHLATTLHDNITSSPRSQPWNLKFHCDFNATGTRSEGTDSSPWWWK
jgi:hypothetical protein